MTMTINVLMKILKVMKMILMIIMMKKWRRKWKPIIVMKWQCNNENSSDENNDMIMMW